MYPRSRLPRNTSLDTPEEETDGSSNKTEEKIHNNQDGGNNRTLTMKMLPDWRKRESRRKIMRDIFNRGRMKETGALEDKEDIHYCLINELN